MVRLADEWSIWSSAGAEHASIDHQSGAHGFCNHDKRLCVRIWPLHRRCTSWGSCGGSAMEPAAPGGPAGAAAAATAQVEPAAAAAAGGGGSTWAPLCHCGRGSASGCRPCCPNLRVCQGNGGGSGRCAPGLSSLPGKPGRSGTRRDAPVPANASDSMISRCASLRRAGSP